MNKNIDKTARCDECGRFIEHDAGPRGSEWDTPRWRHLPNVVAPHAARPEPGSVMEVPR
jgi:hypothetical protein